MPDDIDLQESSTPEGDVTPQDDGGSEVQPDTDDAEQLKATNAKLYARTKKAEARVKELEAKVPKEQPSQPNPSPSDDPRFERLELKTDGYSADEVDFIMQNGGRKALENAFVKDAIATARKRAKSLDATPSDTSKSKVYQNYTKDQIDAMPTAELEKILPRA